MAAIAAAFTLASCGEKEDDSWMDINTGEVDITTGSAIATVNGVQSQSGTISLVPANSETGTVSLTGVIPGYSTSIEIPVQITKLSDTEWSFEGSQGVTDPSIMSTLTKATEVVSSLTINVNGTATTTGTIKATVSTTVGSTADSNLVGEWKLSRSTAAVETELGVLAEVWPAYLNWTLSESYTNPMVPVISALGCSIASNVLAEVFDGVTFDSSGQVSISFCMADNADIDGAMGGEYLEGGEDTGAYYFGSSHDTWASLPLTNLCYWFNNSEHSKIYFVPNIKGLLAFTGDTDSEVSLDMSFMTELGQYGVDVTSLTSLLMEIMNSGIPLDYKLDGNSLQIYLGMESLTTLLTPFLPALETLDALYAAPEEALGQLTETQLEIRSYLQTIVPILGFSKPSDFNTLLANTTDLSIGISLTK